MTGRAWFRGGRPVLAAVALAAVAWAPAAAQEAQGAQEEDAFDHEEHAGLFPLCTGCHEGVPEDRSSAVFPGDELCARCHDGADLDEVEWSPPEPRHELRFVHTEHEELLQEEDTILGCAGCHGDPEGDRMVGVYRTEQETCAGCHAHETTDHLVVGTCEACHVPLAESGWSDERIAAMETPSDHEPADPYLADVHGPDATEQLNRCATCHTQDRCALCHVNASVVDEIQSIPAAPVGMALPKAQARYPTPESHEAFDFLEDHRTRENGAECSACHTTDDCASCHYDTGGNGFRATFAADQVVAPGVQVTSEAPASHATPYFMADHTTLATNDDALCASCHTTPFCNDCHDAPGPTAFHEPNFVTRHTADAYGRNMECANCHSAEVFCRACHVEQGLGSSGRLTVGYHDAEPVWLLRHGQAARQSLETCQSCHTQSECLQCHSQFGSFQVSPHTRDFDARRAQERNPAICFACHLTDPLNPGR